MLLAMRLLLSRVWRSWRNLISPIKRRIRSLSSSFTAIRRWRTASSSLRIESVKMCRNVIARHVPPLRRRGIKTVKRREFIFGSAGFLYQAAAVQQKLIVRSASPTDFETPVQLLDKSWLTPNDVHYVRAHLPTPNVQLSNWSLTVEGEVNQALNLTMNEMHTFKETNQTVTLECSGNGRAYADPPVAGVQWEKGAVGTARWTGVSLRDVLTKAQPKPAAKHVILNGADVPVGAVPDFVRSIPIEKAMHPDTIF